MNEGPDGIPFPCRTFSMRREADDSMHRDPHRLIGGGNRTYVRRNVRWDGRCELRSTVSGSVFFPAFQDRRNILR